MNQDLTKQLREMLDDLLFEHTDRVGYKEIEPLIEALIELTSANEQYMNCWHDSEETPILMRMEKALNDIKRKAGL